MIQNCFPIFVSHLPSGLVLLVTPPPSVSHSDWY